MIKVRGLQDDMFEKGRLQTLLKDLRAGKPTKAVRQLTVDQLAQVPSMFAKIDLNLYIPSLEDDLVFETANGKKFYSQDLKAIVMLMYLFPRSAYCKFDRGEHQYRSTVGGQVPLPLLGFKRFRNISYDKWREKVCEFIGWTWNKENECFVFDINDRAAEAIFKVDLMLGKTYASTQYDTVTDSIEMKDPNKHMGLVLLSSIVSTHDKFKMTADNIRLLRERGTGNYNGSTGTIYGSKKLEKEELRELIPIERIAIYNQADTPMRMMLRQGWGWYGMHRTDDVIVDPSNWDNKLPNLDNMGAGFIGVAPQAAVGGELGKSKVFGV